MKRPISVRSACFMRMVFTVVMVVGFPLSSLQAHDWGSDAWYKEVPLSADRHEIKELREAGYDIAGINLETNTVSVVVRNQNEELGLKFLNFKTLASKPVNTALAPDNRYKTYEEVTEFLNQQIADFPHLTKLESIGRSHEGRDIWAIKISDNPELNEVDEPSILFNAMHHAREVMTVEVAFDTIEHLLNGYGSDETITHWVDSNEIWIVPMLNPDGNHRVWNQDNMWRKNSYKNYGVDINRNYPYAWGSCRGSSGSTWAQDYRGPSAGSEPETQALMNLVSSIQPVFNISYHSYSEIVIYPYGCRGERSPQREVVEEIGEAIAQAIPRDSGRGTYQAGTSWELLYSVDGGDIDWMHHEHQVLPYVIELNSSSLGFQPSYSYRQETVEKTRNAWKLLLNKLDQSGIRGHIDPNHTDVSTLSITVTNQLSQESLTWPVKKDGSFHIILKPGTYFVELTNGMTSQSQEVVVGNERVDLTF